MPTISPIPTKKLSSGFTIPVFGFGCWKIGGDRQRNPNNDDQGDISAMKRALEAGVTHFDTAEKYAEGHSEELLGQAIVGYDRKDLFITTKVNKMKLRHDEVLQSLNQSLERLQTDYVDLYLIHAPSPDNVPIEETMAAMDELVASGRVRHIGVSNFSIEEFEAAQKASKNKLMCNQVYYNLGFRKPEHDGVLEFCQTNNVFLNAWRPIERGILAQGGNPLLDQVAQKYGKTPAQVAINWLVSQTNVITISKMSRPEHLQENLGALNWTMEADDIELLRHDFPGQVFSYDDVTWEAPNSLNANK